MGVLFLILKIIGIVLLGLLALLLLALLIILYVPFRYRIHASYYDTADIQATVSWLLHAISVSLCISKDDKKCRIKVFGICILDLFHPKPRKEKKRKKKSDTKKDETKHSKQLKRTEQSKKTSEFVIQHDDSTLSEDDTPKDAGFFEKIISFFTRIKEAVWSLKIKIQAVREKQIDLQEQGRKWITVLKRDRTKKALSKCKDILIKMLKTILPRKWSAYVHFGMDDPATTAQILGYYWMFIGILANHVTCLPDFENKVMEGELKAKGHIRMITFVLIGLKVLFDPDLIYLRKIKAEVDSL